MANVYDQFDPQPALKPSMENMAAAYRGMGQIPPETGNNEGNRRIAQRFRVEAEQIRQKGDEENAAKLEARADEIEKNGLLATLGESAKRGSETALSEAMSPAKPVQRILASAEKAFKDAPSGSLEEELAAIGLLGGEFAGQFTAPINAAALGSNEIVAPLSKLAPAAKPILSKAAAAMNLGMALPMAEAAGAAAGEASVHMTPSNVGEALGTAAMALLGGAGAAHQLLTKPVSAGYGDRSIAELTKFRDSLEKASVAAAQDGLDAGAEMLSRKATEFQEHIDKRLRVDEPIKPAAEAAQVFENQAVNDERVRQSPQGAAGLGEDLRRQEKGGQQELPLPAEPFDSTVKKPSQPVPTEETAAGMLSGESAAPAASRPARRGDIPAGQTDFTGKLTQEFGGVEFTKTEKGWVDPQGNPPPNAAVTRILDRRASGEPPAAPTPKENLLSSPVAEGELPLVGETKKAPPELTDIERRIAEIQKRIDQPIPKEPTPPREGATSEEIMAWKESRKPFVEARNAQVQAIDELNAALEKKREQDRASAKSTTAESVRAETEADLRQRAADFGGEPEVVAVNRRPLARKARRSDIPEGQGELGLETGLSKPELHQNPEQWADAVIAERRGQVSAGLDPELATAYTIKGAYIIGRGVRDFTQWSKEMVKQFGAEIKPHLQMLWDHSTKTAENLGENKMTELEHGDINSRLGTAAPTSINAAERGHTHQTVIDLERLRRDPELVAKAETVIKKYYPQVKATDDPIGALVQHAKDNLMYLYDQVPEEVRARTKRWYDGARRLTEEWSKRYDLPRETVAGVMAALSPQKDWFQNLALAERLIETFKNPPNGGRMSEQMHDIISGWIVKSKENAKTKKAMDAALSDATRQAMDDSLAKMRNTPFSGLDTFEKAVWVRAYSEAHLPDGYYTYGPEGNTLGIAKTKKGEVGKLAWSGFNSELSAAISILENPSRENISLQLGNEHKVRNFFNNILLPNDPRFGDVTIDTHAVAAALLKALSGKSTEVKHNFGTSGASSVHGVSGLYPVFAEAYRQAAAEVGLLPREMQSITWEAVRGLFPKELKKGLAPKIEAIWDKYVDGTLTLKQTRQEITEIAGRVRTPEWLVSDFGVPEKEGLAGNARQLPVSEPTRLSGAYRGGSGGWPASPVSGGVPETAGAGELSFQARPSSPASERLFSRAAEESSSAQAGGSRKSTSRLLSTR